MPVVFIADDHPDDYYQYRQAFGEACPTAVLYFFRHKAELLDALQGNVYPSPALLIMDWNMDLHEGYTTLSVLSHAPAWQAIPVVIMTTQNQPVDQVRCEQAGYELVLPKETHDKKLVTQLTGLVQALL